MQRLHSDSRNRQESCWDSVYLQVCWESDEYSMVRMENISMFGTSCCGERQVRQSAIWLPLFHQFPSSRSSPVPGVDSGSPFSGQDPFLTLLTGSLSLGHRCSRSLLPVEIPVQQ